MSHFQTITTIYHDGQFWVAMIERLDGDRVDVARHVFGAEPSNAELLAWAGKGFAGLDFQPAPARALPEPSPNPKRRKREAAAELKQAGPSSRARDVVKAAAAFGATERSAARAESRHAISERRYADRVARKKARRLGKG
ncbi:MAG: YjdF family protein [Alphaproteobacteria bacterium]|nr:YjdF family protein [Alphaproteobacteria bacterium]